MMQIRRCLRTKTRPLGVLLVIFIVISLFYFNQEQADILDRPQIIGLLVNTSGYALPEYNPWDPTLRKILAPGIEVDCTGGKHPLTSTIYLPQTNGSNEPLKGRQGHLVYHRSREWEFSLTKISCCYQVITRGPSQSLKNYTEDTDSRYKLGPCIPVVHNVTLIKEAFIYVKCQNPLYFPVYRNVHHFIQNDYLNSIISEKLLARKLVKSQSSTNSKNSKNHRPLSVMLMGLDSTSRNNLQRYLPKTFAYLKESNAIDLQGYNKVGDNTFPNLLPLLSGMKEKTLLASCTNGRRTGPFDNCPFIWKNFSSRGYITAFGEDSKPDGTFNYEKRGFIFPPTDFYLRPFIQASEHLVGHFANKKHPMKGYCLGTKSPAHLIYDYAEDFINMSQEIPSFSLFWSSKFTHDTLHLVSAIDERTKNFLKRMSENEDLILIFLSDHGLRFGDIRRTIIGKYEENLPFSYILLPKRFKEKYEEAYNALVENQYRLVVPYDIHATLDDILNQRYMNKKYLSLANNVNATSLSLFREIPQERNCNDANIPYHFCSGVLLDVVENFKENEEIQNISKRVVDFMNDGLSQFKFCEILKVKEVLRARNGTIMKRGNPNVMVNLYEIVLVTSPGNAELEATLIEESGHFALAGEISRVNRYGETSACIKNGYYRKYCMCKPQPKKPTSVSNDTKISSTKHLSKNTTHQNKSQNITTSKVMTEKNETVNYDKKIESIPDHSADATSTP